MGIDADDPLPGRRRLGSTQAMSRSIFIFIRDAVGEIPTKLGTEAEEGVRGELMTLVPPLTLVCGEPLFVVAEMTLCDPFPTRG